MGFDLFYKVRAERKEDGSIAVTEKGLLRYLTSRSARERIVRLTREEMQTRKDLRKIYATYIIPDPNSGLQIGFYDFETAQRIGLD